MIDIFAGASAVAPIAATHPALAAADLVDARHIARCVAAVRCRFGAPRPATGAIRHEW